MNINAGGFTGVVLASFAYWIIFSGVWLFYTTRPATQARARERDLKRVDENADTGVVVMEFGSSINMMRVALVLLGPPLLLVLVWLLAGMR